MAVAMVSTPRLPSLLVKACRVVRDSLWRLGKVLWLWAVTERRLRQEEGLGRIAVDQLPPVQFVFFLFSPQAPVTRSPASR